MIISPLKEASAKYRRLAERGEYPLAYHLVIKFKYSAIGVARVKKEREKNVTTERDDVVSETGIMRA